MSPEKSFLRSGELAELAGVSTDTLRHYERKGVLTRPPRRANGYRQYPGDALRRVQLIRRALAVGFTLDELATVLRVRDTGGAACAEVRALAATKLAGVQKRMRELTDLRNELKVILKDWDDRLEHRASGEPIHLLESLNGRNHSTLGNQRRVSQGHLDLRKRRGVSNES